MWQAVLAESRQEARIIMSSCCTFTYWLSFQRSLWSTLHCEHLAEAGILPPSKPKASEWQVCVQPPGTTGSSGTEAMGTSFITWSSDPSSLEPLFLIPFPWERLPTLFILLMPQWTVRQWGRWGALGSKYEEKLGTPRVPTIFNSSFTCHYRHGWINFLSFSPPQ